MNHDLHLITVLVHVATHPPSKLSEHGYCLKIYQINDEKIKNDHGEALNTLQTLPELPDHHCRQEPKRFLQNSHVPVQSTADSYVASCETPSLNQTAGLGGLEDYAERVVLAHILNFSSATPCEDPGDRPPQGRRTETASGEADKHLHKLYNYQLSLESLATNWSNHSEPCKIRNIAPSQDLLICITMWTQQSFYLWVDEIPSAKTNRWQYAVYKEWD